MSDEHFFEDGMTAKKLLRGIDKLLRETATAQPFCSIGEICPRCKGMIETPFNRQQLDQVRVCRCEYVNYP